MRTLRSPRRSIRVPWRLIGQRLHARTAGDIVQIFAGADVVATHVRRPSGRSTDFSHYPPEKIAFAMKTPTWCRRTAELVGPACEAVIAEFMADNAIHHLRSAQGVLGLRDKHGCERLEAACARAIDGRRPVLSHHQGHPDRRHRTRRARTDHRCRRGGRGVSARPRPVRHRHRHHRLNPANHHPAQHNPPSRSNSCLSAIRRCAMRCAP